MRTIFLLMAIFICGCTTQSNKDTITINSLQTLLVGIIPVLVTAFLTYLFGLKIYLKKRVHEQIIKRYLEQGVDLLTANIDYCLSVFRENWAHSLRLLKEFRETSSKNIPMLKESYEEHFLKYEPKHFSLIPFYKIKAIVGDDIFWHTGQLLFAFVGNSYSFFENDLRLFIANWSNDKVNITSLNDLYKNYVDEVKRLNVEANKFYLILMQLQNIALLIETKPMSFKDLEKLKDSTEIKEAIRSLHEEFKLQDTMTDLQVGD